MTLRIGRVKTNQIDGRYIYGMRVSRNIKQRQIELGHYREMDDETKKRIRQRDHYTCQLCGNHGWMVDHIKPWRLSHDNSDSNLRVLCRKCNIATRLPRRDARLPFEEWAKHIETEVLRLNT